MLVIVFSTAFLIEILIFPRCRVLKLSAIDPVYPLVVVRHSVVHTSEEDAERRSATDDKTSVTVVIIEQLHFRVLILALLVLPQWSILKEHLRVRAEDVKLS